MSLSRIIKTPRFDPDAVVVESRADGGPSPAVTASTAGRRQAMLREQAEHEAQTLLDNAASEAAHLRAQAHQDGYAQGLEEARRHMQDQLARLGEIVQRAHADTAQILRNVERDVIDLVLLIAERVVYRELSLNPSLVVEAVRQAMEVAETGIVVRVRVNPEDLAFVEAAWQDVAAEHRFQAVELAADRLVQRGGCVVETRTGAIDAQVDSKIAEVERVLLEQAGGDL